MGFKISYRYLAATYKRAWGGQPRGRAFLIPLNYYV